MNKYVGFNGWLPTWKRKHANHHEENGRKPEEMEKEKKKRKTYFYNDAEKQKTKIESRRKWERVQQNKNRTK